MAVQSSLIPHADPDYDGCYEHQSDPVYLSDWLLAHGFRVVHTSTMHEGDQFVHANYPLIAGLALVDAINGSIDTGGTPFCATLHNEDGLSLTVYPALPAGSVVRPNGAASRRYLARLLDGSAVQR